MKTFNALFACIITVNSVYANENIDIIIENARQQVGYGLKQAPESQHGMVEYTKTLDLQLQNGIKSLMLKKSRLTADLTIHLPNISGKCANDTVQMFHDIMNSTNINTYAFSMLDSDGKPGSGIHHGNLIWLGNRQQCQETASDNFKGQMCEIYTNAVLSKVIPLPWTFDGCFPDSCSETDVGLLVWDVLKEVKIIPTAVQCPEELNYSNGDIVALVVSGLIGFAVVVGTLADILFMYTDDNVDKETIKVRKDYSNLGLTVNDSTERLGLLSNVAKSDVIMADNTAGCCTSTFRQILLSFSLISNTRKLLNTSTASGSLTAINGMRVISMWWVILGHTFAFNYTMVDNIVDFIYILKRFTFQVVINGTYSVDTFFFMSGLLVSYTVMKKLKDGRVGSINWPMFYFHRFWRLTPVYAFAIMIWTTLYRHWIKNGSFYIGFQPQFTVCEKYWWTNILYINNFHPGLGGLNKECMGWGWYLANDMQFYLISPLFLLLLHWKRRVGISVLLLVLCGCLASRIITANYYGMRLPGINQIVDHKNESWADSSPLYNKPYTRLPVYLVGLWLGYILVLNSNRVIMHKIKLLIGWCVAIAMGMLIIYGLYGFYKDVPVMHVGNKAESLIYIGFSRFAWSLALAWVIFVCAVGYGGAVNQFLSWKVWAPLGRLTYCAYIVHPAVIFYFMSNREKPLHYTDLVFMEQYISMLVVSYVVAFVLSMTVEAPMLALEKVVFKRWLK